jgi:MFS family permease
MAGLLSLLSGVWLFVLLRPDPRQMDLALALHPTETQKTTAPHHAARPLRQIFASPTVQLATIVMVVSQLVMTLLMVITPVHMHHHNHAHTNISLVLTAHTLGMFGLSSLTGWLVERTSRYTVIVVGGLVLALSSVLAPFSLQLAPLAFALFLLGLGWNFCFIASSSLLADALAPGERGRAQGANEMMVALIAGAGSLSSGAAFAYGGITTVSALGLAMSVLLVCLSIWSMRRQTAPLASMQT